MLASLGKIIQRIGGVIGAIFLLIGAIQILGGGWGNLSGFKNAVIGLVLIVITSYVAKALGHKD